MLLSKIELIEEFENEEYNEQQRLIAQKREFELIKVQREEAHRIRRDKEIERRNEQKKQRIIRDCITQKKITAKFFAKTCLRNLKSNVFDNLIKDGFFMKKTTMKVIDMFATNNIPVIENYSNRSFVNKAIFENILNKKKTETKSIHSILLNDVFTDRKNKENARIKEAEEKRIADEIFEKEKAERKEIKRVNKFTKIVEDTILKTKYEKADLNSVPLCDIDDLTQVSSGIHTAGGQLGELLICLQILLEELIYKYANIDTDKKHDENMMIKDMEENSNLNMDLDNVDDKDIREKNNNDPNNNNELIKKDEATEKLEKLKAEMLMENSKKLKESLLAKPYQKYYDKKKDLLKLEEFIRHLIVRFLSGLKDNENLTLKYLESNRFDFNNIPDDDLKRNEFKNFIVDKRRIYNKSVKILLETNLLERQLFDIILDEISNIYFFRPLDVNSDEVKLAINPTPENQDPEYLVKVKERTDKIVQFNSLYTKIQKKIKLSFVKPEIYKKKRNNIIALIRIHPLNTENDVYNEEYIEEVIEEEEVEEMENDNPKDKEDLTNIVVNNNDENNINNNDVGGDVSGDDKKQDNSLNDVNISKKDDKLKAKKDEKIEEGKIK